MLIIFVISIFLLTFATCLETSILTIKKGELNYVKLMVSSG